jgi:hypothetical protein
MVATESHAQLQREHKNMEPLHVKPKTADQWQAMQSQDPIETDINKDASIHAFHMPLPPQHSKEASVSCTSVVSLAITTIWRTSVMPRHLSCRDMKEPM